MAFDLFTYFYFASMMSWSSQPSCVIFVKSSIYRNSFVIWIDKRKLIVTSGLPCVDLFLPPGNGVKDKRLFESPLELRLLRGDSWRSSRATVSSLARGRSMVFARLVAGSSVAISTSCKMDSYLTSNGVSGCDDYSTSSSIFLGTAISCLVSSPSTKVALLLRLLQRLSRPII